MSPAPQKAWGQQAPPLTHLELQIFAGLNINLLRAVYGRDVFERLTASGADQPPAAEPLAAVFQRTSEFYEQRVRPLTAAGKNVLVVAHQYALEPLALYLGGKKPSDYHGALDLPNGKALSDKELAAFQAHHAGGMALKIKRLRDYALIHGMVMAAVAGFAGMAVKLAIARAMPAVCFTVLITVVLAVSSFYIYMRGRNGGCWLELGKAAAKRQRA